VALTTLIFASMVNSADFARQSRSSPPEAGNRTKRVEKLYPSDLNWAKDSAAKAFTFGPLRPAMQ
jgi:hypothetical protein